jgi:hypothetical protein
MMCYKVVVSYTTFIHLFFFGLFHDKEQAPCPSVLVQASPLCLGFSSSSESPRSSSRSASPNINSHAQESKLPDHQFESKRVPPIFSSSSESPSSSTRASPSSNSPYESPSLLPISQRGPVQAATRPTRLQACCPSVLAELK